MNKDGERAAMALEMLVNERDPIERFIEGIKDPHVQADCRRTLAMREEFIERVRRLLLEDEASRALGHATWVARNVLEVSYRWWSLRTALRRWMMRDMERVTFAIRRGVEEGDSRG